MKDTGLVITTLGDLRIRNHGEIITSFSSHKAEALLVYLAVEKDTAHRRESLFTLLWPGMPEKSARHNLRQVLYALGQTFSVVASSDSDETVPLLLSDRSTVQINPRVAIQIDVHQLDRYLQETQMHDHLSRGSCETCLQILEEIVDLYAGDFLRDFYLEDSNAFEDWADANRVAYRSKVLNALEILTEIHIQKGAYDQARTFAEQQLKIDPLREIAYRQLMELLSKSGQRAEALRIYQQCAAKLEIELGTHPSRETTALFEIIRGDDLRQPATTLHEGAIRGYEIREHLGTGHAAAVYRAFQPVIGRDVAIKVILPQFANHPDFIRRFEVEAQLVARLEHPYIVPLYDYWRDPSGAYLVMRWLKGGNLQSALKLGPWKPASAVELVDQICAALSLAHHQGVVHCDIKPANILLDDEGNAYLTDFGIAILTGPLAQLSQHLHTSNISPPGSLGYSPPEATRGQPPTSLADIYSLGVLLFELLCGVHPFAGVEGEILVQKHLTEPLPSVLALRSELPEAVDAVIQRATAKDPAARYPDVESLARDFRLALTPEAASHLEIPTVAIITRNPYKGLRPFAEADAVDFFGRDDLVTRLLEKLSPTDSISEPAHFLAVVGPSGSGKSSVVKAGLIPAIRRGAIPSSEGWFIAEMTPSAHPLEELETALLRIAIQTPEDLLDQLSIKPRGLVRLLRRALPGVKSEVLLIIDQFEELFTLVADDNERSYFLELLSAAVSDPYSPLRLLITLRADFYDRPLQHAEFGELVRRATEVVLPLAPAELERAICAPAEGVGASLEPALVARILQEVGDQPGTLPLLQYALTECFEHRDNNLLSLESYETSGGVLGALGRRAEEIYRRLTLDQQNATRQIFLRLVTQGEGIEDTRRRVLRTEIEAAVGQEPAVFLPVIEQYGRFRLLTFDHDPTTRAPIIEVAHEALLREWPRLRTWLDESRSDIRMQRLLSTSTQEWLAAGKGPGFLLRGARLDQFSLWYDDTNLALTTDEQAYLTASLKARAERRAAEALRQAHEAQLEQRSRRFLRALVGVFAVAAVVAAVLLIYTFNAQRTAQSEADARGVAEALAVEERDRALAAEQEALKQASIGLAAQALQEMKTANSERGVLLALAALEEYPYTPQAEAALGRSVQESLPYKMMSDNKGQSLDGHWADWSPDGKRIAIGRAPNTDGERSAVVYELSSGEIDLVLPLVIENSAIGTNTLCSVQQINWSPDGTRLALVVNNNNLDTPQPYCYRFQVYDASTGNLVLDLDSQGEFAVDWSPDGKQLLTGGEGGQVQIWDAENGDIILNMIGHTANGFEIFPNTSDRVLAARFSTDGQFAATFSVGGSVHIWNASTGELLQTLVHPPEIIQKKLAYPGMNKIGLTWSPDGRYLATAWYDGVGRIWDIETGQVQRILAGHTSNLIGIDWSPDGNYILTQGVDSSARLWAAATGQLILTLPTIGYGNATWSLSGNWMAVPTQQGALAWDISVLPPLLSPSEPVQYRMTEARWTPDGSLLVIGGRDGLVFDWLGDRSSRNISPTEGFIDFSSDSTRIISTEGLDMKVPQIIDLRSGKVVMEFQNPDPEVMYFTNSWSHDGQKVASGTYPGYRTVIWNPETGEQITRSEIVDGFMIHAQFSPDDTILAAPSVFAEGNSPVYLIDTTTGKTIRELSSEDGWSCTAMWSPDGKLLAVGYQNGAIKLWNTETWEIEREFRAHQGMIWDLGWSPNGERIISGEAENSVIYVWDATTGDIILSWDMQGVLPAGFDDTDWSPDGQFVIIQGGSGGGMPYIKRVWQSTEDLIDYAYDCCVWRELTPEERIQFGLPEKP